MKVGIKLVTFAQAHFHLEVWILVSREVRSGLDGRTRTLNPFSLNFGPEGAGDGRFYRTASGECTLMGELDSFKVTMKTVCVDL